MPTLTVTRAHHWPDRLRAYRLFLDGRRVGKIRPGKALTVAAQPGPHILQARIDWCRSRPLQIDVGDQDLRIKVHTGLRGWKILLAGVYIAFRRNQYLLLEEETADTAARPTAAPGSEAA